MTRANDQGGLTNSEQTNVSIDNPELFVLARHTVRDEDVATGEVFYYDLQELFEMMNNGGTETLLLSTNRMEPPEGPVNWVAVDSATEELERWHCAAGVKSTNDAEIARLDKTLAAALAHEKEIGESSPVTMRIQFLRNVRGEFFRWYTLNGFKVPGSKSPRQRDWIVGDRYAKAVRPNIEQAKTQSDVYAIALAVIKKKDGLAAENYKSATHVGLRDRIRMGLSRAGYLPAGRRSPEKLKTLVDRIIAAVDLGEFPPRP